MNFNMGALTNWHPVAIGQLMAFETEGFRHVEFDVMANGPVTVNVVGEGEYWTVAQGSGLMHVKFSIADNVEVVMMAPEGVDAWMRAGRGAQVMPDTGEPTFTTIEPQRSGPPDEIKRLMLMVQANAKRREQLLLAEINEMRAAQISEQMRSQPAPAGDPPVVE